MIGVYCNDEPQNRAKRYDGYYGGYGYDGWGGDWWYGGRFIGLILGIFLLMLCCCVPLICLAGIWFMGWFGIKGRRDARLKSQGVAYGAPAPQIVQLHSEPQPVIRTVRARSLSPTRNTFATQAPAEQVIYTAEDRYYTSSTSPPRHNSRI
ncbi:unnamed protein product, partial [Mesorhabditis belari]|uniref:Uncharacterized protein n=1 Tax=Mesorhabditis belari TaxID=2138241 RepID=A0AAF3F109_9BILA